MTVANGHDPLYFTTGNYNGAANGKGKVDNNLYSGLFLYTVAGHTFGGGYQVSNGSSDFPWLNQGDGSSNYTITDAQIQKFGRAGERTWQARYSYDFAKVGVPGLTAGLVYLHGDNIDTVNAKGGEAANGASEWERDLSRGLRRSGRSAEKPGPGVEKRDLAHRPAEHAFAGRKPPDRQLLDPAVVIALA